MPCEKLISTDFVSVNLNNLPALKVLKKTNDSFKVILFEGIVMKVGVRKLLLLRLDFSHFEPLHVLPVKYECKLLSIRHF